MKILAIFVDMLGADYINISNKNAERTDIDEVFSSLGGTFYSNCYTPAPDTPRSTACMWSGLYPKENGCDNRLKWPSKFLEAPNNLWTTLRDNGYHFNVYLRKSTKENGLLPKSFGDLMFDGNIDEFMGSFELSENAFVFMYLSDLHTMLDCYGYTPGVLKKGTNFVAKILKKIFARLDKDCFDYIMIFSDHGFRYSGSKGFLLGTDRVRTTMFIRKRGEEKLRIDARLCSNLDLFPTVCEMINTPIPSGLDGCSILSSKHSYVLLEDHEDFSNKLSQTIEHWGVVLEGGIFLLECSGKWNTTGDCDFDGSYWESLIREKMSDYQKNRKLWDALHTYEGVKSINRIYSDGSLIKKPIYRKGILGFFRKVFSRRVLEELKKMLKK